MAHCDVWSCCEKSGYLKSPFHAPVACCKDREEAAESGAGEKGQAYVAVNWVMEDKEIDVETELALGFLDYLMLMLCCFPRDVGPLTWHRVWEAEGTGGWVLARVAQRQHKKGVQKECKELEVWDARSSCTDPG
eukprot:1138534-Pelagomonas_calceolata.AAC.11